MTDTLQFGRPLPGKTYKDRPAAFGLVFSGGRLALVEVTWPGSAAFYDLPGGALDPGEDEPQALAREFGEEAGLKVQAGRLITRASQYFLKEGGEAVNNRCAFYEAELLGDAPELKVEDDHELVWMEPQRALELLRHDAHAWAVTAWLR